MNVTPEQEMQNPWKNKADLPRVDTKRTVWAVLACFVSSLALPLSSYEWISLIVLGLLFAYVVISARMPNAVILPLFTSVLAVMMTGSFSVGAIALSFIVGTSATAFLFTTLKLPYLVLTIPLISAVSAFAVTKDLFLSLLALSFLPSALLLTYATLSAKRRTVAVCFAAGGLLITAAVIVLIVLYQACGSFNATAVMAYINSLREQLTQAFIGAKEQILQMLAEAGNDAATLEMMEQVRAMFSDAYFSALASQLFVILPALLTVICCVLAFESQLLLLVHYRVSGLGKVVTRESATFTMSISAALLYVVALFIMLFSRNASTVLSVAQNVCLILMPGFCVLGIHSVVVLFARSRGAMRVALVILFVAMFCGNIGSALYVVALWGACDSVMLVIRQKLVEKMKQNENNDDFDDRDQF